MIRAKPFPTRAIILASLVSGCLTIPVWANDRQVLGEEWQTLMDEARRSSRLLEMRRSVNTALLVEVLAQMPDRSDPVATALPARQTAQAGIPDGALAPSVAQSEPAEVRVETSRQASTRITDGGPSVVDQIAFEKAVSERLTQPAPASVSPGIWKAIGELYGPRVEKAFWRRAGRWTPSARAAVARLNLSRDDALTLPRWAPGALGEGSPEALAAQEVQLTAAVVVYARQAAGERIDPLKISKLITARPALPDPRDVVDAVSVAGDHASDVLTAFNPSHAGYRALRSKLSELRHAATPTATRIPAGPALRLGMRDARVKLVRARFGLEISASETTEELLYDTRVADAVAGFQRERGLPPNGVLTPRTVALLSGGEPRRLENEIIANMERWRWLPRDLGADRIEVDIPNYSLALVRDGAVVHRARVIVGKPQNPTPIFSNAVKTVVVNPSWFIPPSILKNEILPKLATDPGYLARLGYEMTVRHGQISARQPPGERNALGRIKFLFPNEHAVYLHDTPSRALFASARRAFSHGCVRVDNPVALAAAVLRGQWSEKRIASLIGGAERSMVVPAPLPIHLEYFTASVAADGRLQFRDDIYGYDRAVMRALALQD